MTPIDKLDARALAGSVLVVSVALGAGVVDRSTGTPSAASSTGSVAGEVTGASRYRVVLTPSRSSSAPAPDRLIEGWGRRFRGDGLAPGRYRLSVIVQPDGGEPRLVVPLPLPADASPIPIGSGDHGRVTGFASDFARASMSGRADDIAPFFDDQFRGPSGQSRAEHLEQARASGDAAETSRFTVTVKSVYRAGPRWFAEIDYEGTYRVRRNGDLRNVSGLFLSELRDDGTRLRFLSTEAIPRPSLSGIEAIPTRFIAAPDVSMVVVRAHATTVLSRPIDVSSGDPTSLGPPR